MYILYIVTNSKPSEGKHPKAIPTAGISVTLTIVVAPG